MKDILRAVPPAWVMQSISSLWSFMWGMNPSMDVLALALEFSVLSLQVPVRGGVLCEWVIVSSLSMSVLRRRGAK
jgi:hypothetical protein